MMIVVDAGHHYVLSEVGVRGPRPWAELVFVKNIGEKYPGNTGEPHGGVLTQEVLRVLIDRTKYLNEQGACFETEMALAAMRQALAWYEVRAARCRGTHIEGSHADVLDNAPVCTTCGHNQCHRTEHERLPGTRR
jgi:hypothetical protein